MTSLQQLFDLTGRTALVTGGAGYLGYSISSALAEAGASVVISSRDLSRARDCVARLPQTDQQAHAAVRLDHKDEASIPEAVAAAMEMTAGVDILINNGQGGSTEDLTSLGGDEFRDQLANSCGYFLLAREIRDHAVSRGVPASIVMIGSMYGLVASYPDAYAGVGPASSVAYQTQKAGIIQMTRHLAVYWAADNIRVNCLTPGPFPQPSVDPQLVERLCAKSPLQRMGRPAEIQGAVLLLASDAGSYITGHNLVVDGGWTAW